MRYFHSLSMLFFLLHSFSSFASSSPTWWFNIGAGAHAKENTLSTPSVDSIVQTSFNGAFSDHSFLSIARTSSSSVYDFGILYGYINRKPKHYWSISTWISYYNYIKVKKDTTPYAYRYQEIIGKGIGFPIECQIFRTPFRHFGFGLIGHAVVDSHPYAALLFGIQIT